MLPVRCTPDALFRWLWALAVAQQCTMVTDWAGSPLGWLLIAAIVAVLLRPGDGRLFGALLVLDLLRIWRDSPFIPNHVFFMGCAEAIILGVLLWRRWRPVADGGSATWAAALRAGLLVLYAFAVLHKLNSDFFDPRHSSAVSLTSDMLGPLDWRWSWLAILGTLAIETAIPLLIAVRATRIAGLLLGAGFHTMLAIPDFTVTSDSLYAFAAVVWPLYLLFVPTTATAQVQAGLNRLPWLASPLRRAALLAGVLALLGAIAVGTTLAADRPLAAAVNRFGFLIFCCCAPLVALVLLRLARARWRRAAPVAEPALPGSRLVPVVALLLVVNGLSPYWGGKTQTCFSMYSNLRTEGGVWNHLILPPEMRLLAGQDDLVRLVESSDPLLRRVYIEPGLLINAWELRRRKRTSG